MQGFKSFPDKTVLTFGEGITGVVGPNGSGKSNISDAVRWVLGEQSTKSLRGAKMEDVIFSGTRDRRAVGYAEVTLRLDNADGALNNPAREVSVTRRYYRSGESAYLINGKTVRLRDVNELFMDTGLGRDGYSLVGQGKIEEMVSAKSENRRDMFEEAAGISHYRYRRADALKRLTQTEENLVRLRDIVAELHARVGPLEKQSVKAQQFLVYAAEKKELEIGLWLNVLSRSAEQIREQLGKMSVVQSQYDAATLALERLSAEIDNAAADTREVNIKTENLRSQISAAEEEAASLESVAAVYLNSVEHNAAAAQRIENDILLQDDAVAALERERAELEAQADALRAQSEETAAVAEALSEKLKNLHSEDEKYSDEYNAENEALGELSLRISRTQIMLSASASSAEEIRQRLTVIEESLAERAEALKALSAQEASDLEKAEQADETLTQMRNAAAGYALRLKRAEEKAAAAKETYENKKLELLQTQQKLRFLEETEKNMEGYGGSVKAVMREKARGTLTGIHGTLISLISVPDAYQTAVETALGNAVQDIVTETESDAKRAIQMLKSANAGRATFLPLSAIRGRTLEEKGLDDMFGYINIAADLVQTDKKYREIVQSLLGRIVVCEDLDCAVTIAKKYAYRFKIVTLDGQVINAGGSMTGGSRASNSGFLARRSQAEKAKKEIASLEEKLQTLSLQMKTAVEALSMEKAQGEGAQADILRLTQESGEKRSALSLTRSAMEENRRSCEALENEKKEAADRLAYLEENVRLAQEECGNLEAEKTRREEALRVLTGGRDALLTQREEINAAISENNVKAVSFMKEMQAKKDAAAALDARRGEISQRKAQLKSELAENAEKSEELRKKAEEAGAGAAALRETIVARNAEIEALIQKREEAEKTTAVARETEKQKNEERERLGAELVRLEERKNALEKEQEDTERKLFEDYGLTRREAAEQAPEIESVSKAQKRLSELKGQIKALGSVNVAAIDEYKEVSSRYEFLSGQVTDVEKSKKELLRLIDELTEQMSERFRDRFEAINNYFKETFRQLFGGGSAELILEDENDILECGIDIKAQPPGKNVKSLSLLSGGEKGLIGIALLFAILKVRPAPFCVFDEVEAALDDVNVVRYAQYVRMMTANSQFILITHRRGTMEEADILYGVTMQEHGVSKLLELKTAQMAAQLQLEE